MTETAYFSLEIIKPTGIKEIEEKKENIERNNVGFHSTLYNAMFIIVRSRSLRNSHLACVSRASVVRALRLVRSDNSPLMSLESLEGSPPSYR